MAGHGEKLGRKQEEAIVALLSHRNLEDAAAAIHVGVRTLLRWMKLPAFHAAYLEARREAVHQAVARLQQATGIASLTMLKLMTDSSVPAAVRLRAADCVFAQALKGIEWQDMELRLSELERASNGGKL